MDSRPHSLRIDDIFLTPDSRYAVLRFHCPACTCLTQETLPIFTSRQNVAGTLIFWECPHCSTLMRLEKKELQEQTAVFYQRRLDGYKKIINQGYVRQYPKLNSQKQMTSNSVSMHAKSGIWSIFRSFGVDKESLKKTWVWPLLHPTRSISRLLLEIRGKLHDISGRIFRKHCFRMHYAQLQKQYEEIVLPHLPWHLEERDAREALAFARALRPLLFIRFGILMRTIGTFMLSSITYVREKSAGFHDTLDYFYLHVGWGCSNYAFLDVISRMINVSPIATQLFHIDYMDQTLALEWRLREKGDETLWQTLGEQEVTQKKCNISPHCFVMQKSYDNHSLNFSTDIKLPFTEQECDAAKAELTAMGIPAESRIICLHVRDNAYYGPGDDDYRNVDVDSYKSMAEYLAALGYFVIRTGAKVVKPILWANERIIDYAVKYRSEFMDIWLFANAELTISTGSGPDGLPYALGHHVLYVDYSDLSAMPFSYPGLSVLPNHFKDENGIRISLREQCTLSRFGEFAENSAFTNKIIPEYPSQDELLDAVKEKLDLISGKKLSPSDMRLQKLFRTQYIKHNQRINTPSNKYPYEKEPVHGSLNALISSIYLRQYKDELEAGKEDWE